VVLARGRAGTTNAAHGNAIAINRGSGITAGRIPVPFIATFTPAVAGPAIAAVINNAAVDGVRPLAKSSTVFQQITAVSLASGAEVHVYANSGNQVLTLALTETLAGALNAWDAAAMAGGIAPVVKGQSKQIRVPIATEVTAGRMVFIFPFTVRAFQVEVLITASGISKLWVGGAVASGVTVTLDNAGATDWAATDTVYVTADE
jgi:hypothetical protein